MLQNRQRVRQMEPSEYVLRAAAPTVPMRNLAAFMAQIDRYEGFVVRRYEDVIFQKAVFARDIAAVLSAEVAPQRLDAIAAQNDVRPDEERPTEHIRQVRPGNFAEHLSQEAQDYLRTKFAPIFARFGYT
ncbi:MAG: hypothetical protein AcusKO_41280 [Acuticoccus sp.]